MNRGYRYKLRAVLGILVIQVRLVLEEVRIQPLLGKLCIRKDIIREFFDLKRNALCFKKRGNSFQNFRMRYRRSSMTRVTGSAAGSVDGSAAASVGAVVAAEFAALFAVLLLPQAASTNIMVRLKNVSSTFSFVNPL